jgi:hypothetical protein
MAYTSDFATVAPVSVTITNGNTTSSEVDLLGATIIGILFPASMTGATLKIQAAAVSGGTFETIQKDEIGGGDYAITISAGKAVPITNLAVVKGWRYIKLVSSATEAADRIITLELALI